MVGIEEHVFEMPGMTTKKLMTFYGNSSETKPTDPWIAEGSVLFETDTGKIFVFDMNIQWGEW